jgi:hypothetical protein
MQRHYLHRHVKISTTNFWFNARDPVEKKISWRELFNTKIGTSISFHRNFKQNLLVGFMKYLKRWICFSHYISICFIKDVSRWLDKNVVAHPSISERNFAKRRELTNFWRKRSIRGWFVPWFEVLNLEPILQSLVTTPALQNSTTQLIAWCVFRIKLFLSYVKKLWPTITLA